MEIKESGGYQGRWGEFLYSNSVFRIGNRVLSFDLTTSSGYLLAHPKAEGVPTAVG
jgi:hypothetical protein